MMLLYAIVLTAFAVYSYVPSRGTLSAYVYFILLALLFFFHARFLKTHKHVSLKKIAFVVSAILLFSYPFLSRDVFNYLFYSKILTFYHSNPFVMRPADFPADVTLKYVYKSELATLYGPSFVLLSAIPSLLSFGNFLASYILFKILMAASYLTGVYILGLWKKEWAVFFATNPLILIEGLVNLHNDLLALVITLGGLYVLFHKGGWRARVLLLFSGLIKYGTLPLVFISKEKRSVFTWLSVTCIVAVLLYACFRGMQPWYLLILFTFIPYWFDQLKRFQFFYFGSLLGYIYYIEHGDWLLSFFYLMIFGSFVINFIYNTTNGFFLRRGKEN